MTVRTRFFSFGPEVAPASESATGRAVDTGVERSAEWHETEPLFSRCLVRMFSGLRVGRRGTSSHPRVGLRRFGFAGGAHAFFEHAHRGLEVLPLMAIGCFRGDPGWQMDRYYGGESLVPILASIATIFGSDDVYVCSDWVRRRRRGGSVSPDRWRFARFQDGR